MKRYQAVRTAEEVQILRERATMLLYSYIAYVVKYCFDEFQASHAALQILILTLCHIGVLEC